MTTTIVIDTNVLVAMVDAHDTWHQRAIALRDALFDSGMNVVFFDCVVNETIGVIARRAEEQQRSEQFGVLLDGLMTLVPADRMTWTSGAVQRLFGETVSLCRTHQGRLNFHDALMALVCKELKMAYILSLDRDFDEVDWLKRVADTGAVEALPS